MIKLFIFTNYSFLTIHLNFSLSYNIRISSNLVGLAA